MLEHQFRALARLQEKHFVLILAIALSFTLIMGYFALDLKTDASFDTMFSPDSDAIVLKDLVATEFGQTDTLFVLFKIDDSVDQSQRVIDMRDPRAIGALYELAQNLLDEPEVNSVNSLAGVLMQTNGRLPLTLEESKEMIASLPPQEFFISDDYTALNLIISVEVPAKTGSVEIIEDKMTKVINEASLPVGTQMVLTGQVTLLNRIINLLINDNITTIGIALFCVFLIMRWSFKSWSMALVAMIPVLLTLTWLAGTMSLLRIRINTMTAAVGAMMVGMGVDYTIHMVHGFAENLKKGVKNVAERTVFSIGGALFASVFTTIAGFLAMLTGVSPSSQIQGTILSMGIAYAFIATVIVLPPVLIMHRKLVYSQLDEVFFKLDIIKEAKAGMMHAFLKKFGAWQYYHAKLIIISVFLITLIILPGMTQVRFDTDNENWIPQGDPVIEAFGEIGSLFGGIEQQNILIRIDPDVAIQDQYKIEDLRDPKVLSRVYALTQLFEQEEYVTFVDGPFDQIIADNDGRLPQSLAVTQDLIEQSPARRYFNDDYSIMLLTIISDGFIDESGTSNNIYYDMLDIISTVPMPQPITVELQGGIAQFVELESSLSADTNKTTLIGFILIILIASLLYRSPIVGLLSFFPIAFAMIWTVGIMGYVDLPFTVLTSGMLAIVMGLGIDFSIHLIHKTKLLLKKTSLKKAVEGAMASTGEAILFSTLTTAIGFSSLILASLLVTRRLGFTLSIAIVCSFFACMLIVPPVLVLEEQFKNRRKTS